MNLNFEQTLRSRRDEIAYRWYQAMQSIGSMVYFREEAIQKFGELTDAVIEYLIGVDNSPQVAFTIGVNLAKLHVINPRVIEVTGELWSAILDQLGELDESEFNCLRQVKFYQIFAGYFERSRQVILTEQEQIRQALVTTIDKTSNELRTYQHHLQEILAERTQELQLTARNFQQITETSMEGILQMDMVGRVLFANQAYAQILGYSVEELRGKSIRESMDEKRFADVGILFQRVLSGEPVRTEFVLRHKNGQPKYVMGSAVRTELTDQIIITAFVTDISARINTENELRLSENRYRTLAETAQALIIIINREDRVEYINTYAANYLGLQPEDIIGGLRSGFFDRTANATMGITLDKAFQGITSRFIENRIQFPNGHLWLSSSLVPMVSDNGEVNSVFIISTDITGIKDSERELLKNKRQLEKRVRERTANLEASQEQSRKLARQIVRTQEEERRRVSRELHDEAGQVLVSLKYELASSFQDLGQDPGQTRKHYENMMVAIDKTMAQIRQLSHSLRPPTLDVAGINLSLEDYCLETAEHTGINIEYHGVELDDLPEEIGISLFRILQEALTNVWKHARASKVLVGLGKLEKMITLSVKDNGKGMAGSSPQDGIGLLGIRERVDILGGSIKLQSLPGKGTHLVVSIPWQDGKN